MRGRKPKSINTILEEGNKSHLSKNEIEQRQEQESKLKELPKDKIRPPTWLNKEAKKIFKQIVKDLEATELLANVDVLMLSILADTSARYIKNAVILDDENSIVEHTNKSGATNKIENPRIKSQRKDAELIKKYSSEFGLSTASRLKLIQPSRNEDDDEFDRDF